MIWRSLVLRPKQRHVFTVAAAFTLMMQFLCLPACQSLSVTAVLIRLELHFATPTEASLEEPESCYSHSWLLCADYVLLSPSEEKKAWHRDGGDGGVEHAE